MREAISAVLDGHMPYPALVARPRGELVTANAAFDLFTEGAPRPVRSPINVLRLAMHPDGVAPRVRNLPGGADTSWIRSGAAPRTPRSGSRPAHRRVVELPARPLPGPDHVGFAVPLHLHTPDGDLRLITTLTSFATATDVTIAELHLEAFLPADAETARILRLRADRHRTKQ